MFYRDLLSILLSILLVYSQFVTYFYTRLDSLSRDLFLLSWFVSLIAIRSLFESILYLTIYNSFRQIEILPRSYCLSSIQISSIQISSMQISSIQISSMQISSMQT